MDVDKPSQPPRARPEGEGIRLLSQLASSVARPLRLDAKPPDPAGTWHPSADYEKAPLTTDMDEVLKLGLNLPPAETLDNAQIAHKLDELIRALAAVGSFLYSTDHLSDRELYSALVGQVLREVRVLMPGGHESARHVDLVGSGSEQDIQLWLRYYADEEDRRRWAHDWPLDPMPPHEHPPHDRDRYLPRPPDRRRR